MFSVEPHITPNYLKLKAWDLADTQKKQSEVRWGGLSGENGRRGGSRNLDLYV